MNISLKASLWAGLVSLCQSIGVVYITSTPSPTSWEEFISVKFVMSLVLLVTGNTPLANKSFRDPKARTRNYDLELIKKND